MPLHRFTRVNYFVKLMIMLGVIVVLAVAAFILAYSFPGILASPPLHFETREIYTFEPWAFVLNGMNISFPGGGTIIPLYIEGKQFGVLLLGCGQYGMTSRAGESYRNPTGFFAAMTEEVMAEKQGDIIFMPVERPVNRRRALKILEHQAALPVLWEGFIPLTFRPIAGAAYYYFLDQTGAPLFPPVLLQQPVIPFLAALFYLLLFAMILLVLAIFTADHHYTPYTKQLLQTPPRKTNLVALFPVLLLTMGGELLSLSGVTPAATASAGYWAAILLLICLARSGHIDYLDFGLRRETVLRGYFMAVAAAAMLAVVTSGIPKGIAFAGWDTGATLIRLFVVAGLAREAIWRGYVQTTLSRRFGTTTGLFLTVPVAVTVHLTLLLFTAPWKFAYPYTLVEIAVLVPGLTLVLGFVYLRSENIAACAFLHALVLFLPQILVP